MFWIGLVAGLFIGIIFTFLILGMCNAAAASDLAMEETARRLKEHDQV